MHNLILVPAFESCSDLPSAILDNCPDGVIAFDLSCCFTYWNSAAHRLTGLSPEKTIGQNAFEIFPSLADLNAQRPLSSVFRGITLPPIDLPLSMVKAERTGHISAQFSPLISDTGTIVGGLGWLRDITEQRRAERIHLTIKRRQDEERFRALFDFSPIGICIIREHGHLMANPAYLKMFGYNRFADLLQVPLFHQVAPHCREKILAISERHAKGHHVADDYEGEGQRQDGSLFHFSVHVSHVQLSDGPATIAFTTDITDRKQADRELEILLARERENKKTLEDSERRFRAIFEQASIGIAEIDRHGRWLRVNRKMAEITGYSQEELVGMSFRDITHPDDLPENLSFREKLQQNQISSYSMEKRYIRKDGSVVWVNIAATLIHTPPGQEGYGISLVEDITQRKQAEADLKEAQLQLEGYAVELERRVAERTSKLQETNSAMESFSYSVSHDLRAPLRSLRGFSQVLLDDYAEKLDANGHDYLQRINRAATRMDLLVRDLLTYSRLSRAELVLSTVSLNALLNDVITNHHIDSPSKNEEIDLVPTDLSVRAHPATLAQSVTNLLQNAVKFMRPGQIPKVRVLCEDCGDTVRIWVEDNGIGIDAKHYDRVFRIFERLHGIDSYSGTGIGLAVVRKVVERMGGTVGVISEVGVGSRFWIQLVKAV